MPHGVRRHKDSDNPVKKRRRADFFRLRKRFSCPRGRIVRPARSADPIGAAEAAPQAADRRPPPRHPLQKAPRNTGRNTRRKSLRGTPAATHAPEAPQEPRLKEPIPQRSARPAAGYSSPACRLIHAVARRFVSGKRQWYDAGVVTTVFGAAMRFRAAATEVGGQVSSLKP